jgi:DNA repair exonuclease SbcCD ATPase subunit
MKINKLLFKNFASYGNRIQEIEFNKEQSDLYLVLGGNGAGKSTLAKVITFMCYGKIEGANLRDIPNRVNKEMWGKIWLESKGNQIEIERGINPGIFNVKINGEEYDVAGKVNLQDFLETEIYEIPYHVFKNVIILSVNDFKSFITMSPYDKKLIIDRIFGFSVINDMREIIKNKRKQVILQIKSLDDEIRTIEESITSVISKIETIEKADKEKTDVRIKELKETLFKLNDGRKKLQEANDKLKAKIAEFDKITKLNNRKESEVRNSIKNTESALSLYSQNACPTCNSPLDSDFHVGIKHEKEAALIQLNTEYDLIKTEVSEAEEKLKEFREHARQILIKVGQMESKMTSIKEDLIKISQRENGNIEQFKNLVKEFNDKRDDKSDVKSKTEGDDYYLSILETIMGEGGIKNLAVRSILPSFNNHIMVMSKEMSIPFSIHFNENFDCTIYHLGNEISPKTLSTGEKKKVDFVIIMAMIKMIKVRFPSLNILFLDEIFSSIDSDGVYHIISILHQTIRDVGLNTFVINHTVLPSEYFDKKIEITKDSGFSEFTIEAIV